MPINAELEKKYSEFLAAHTERVAPLYTARGLASWDVATSPDDTAPARWTEADLAIAAIYQNADEYAFLNKALEAADGDLKPNTRRSLEVLQRYYLLRQGDQSRIEELSRRQAELRRAFGTFRPKRDDGTSLDDGAIAEVLETSTDNDQRKAMWEASHEVGAHVAKDIIELVELRNEHAVSLGFANYYELGLHLQEMDPDWLAETLQKLDAETTASFTSKKASLDTALAKRFEVAPADLKPWHYQDPFFQRPPATESQELEAVYATMDMEEVATRFFDGLAADVRPVLAASDLYPREAKNQHAFCTHIDRQGDVRTLCNLRPTHRWMTTLLHEFGHAIYDRYIDRKLPWALRTPSHTLTTESIALLMGRVASEPEFLVEFGGVPPLEIAAHTGALRRQLSFNMLTFTRWVLVMTTFERELYANPRRKDLNDLWWSLREKYQGISRPDGRKKSPDWAAKIHFAIAPVYYHNYLLGELLASQLREKVLKDSESRTLVENFYAGEWLISDFFSVGNSMTWRTHIRNAIGKEFSPDAFLQEYVA
jgi:peptidyl-dipeptidase A